MMERGKERKKKFPKKKNKKIVSLKLAKKTESFRRKERGFLTDQGLRSVKPKTQERTPLNNSSSSSSNHSNKKKKKKKKKNKKKTKKTQRKTKPDDHVAR